MTGTITDTHRYLRAWRLAKGWKLERLAEQIGSKKNTISGWENGRRRINLDDLKKLADVYKVRPQDLLDPPDGDPDRHSVFVAYDSDPVTRELLIRAAKGSQPAAPEPAPDATVPFPLPTRPPPSPHPGGSVAQNSASDCPKARVVNLGKRKIG
jgi:transcriptional regulator with XRE-family HTH domain